jgi:hypothetical protein
LVLVLWSVSARGDYRDNFANGIIALERGDAQEAVRLLAAAVQENPVESTERVKIYGMRYKEYVPHYFLGIAYSKSGNCVGAIEALTESARQGIAQGIAKNASEWGTIKDNLEQCIKNVAKAPRPTPRTTEPAFAQKQAPRPTETPVAVAQNPSPRPPVATPELVAQAAPAPTVAAPPTRAPSARPTTLPPPPDTLLSAAAMYFRGNYAATVRALASARYSDARSMAQAFLFRSAAGYGLFVLGGSKEKALEERAARDARESSRLDPNLRVSPKAFSPRFLEFYARSKI